MNYTSFVTERNEALLSLDREKIERFAKKYGVTMPTSEEAFWRGVHKAICNITNIPFEVRQKSAGWLFEHGSTPDVEGNVMRAVVCDRCGKTEQEYYAATISYPYGRYMGEPDEQYLCGECRKKLSEWIKGDA